MQGGLSATLDGTTDSWIDERGLDTGICSSTQLFQLIDREPNYLKAKVSLANGAPGLTVVMRLTRAQKSLACEQLLATTTILHVLICTMIGTVAMKSL